MHLARRGGRKSEKKIVPADVDGVVVSLRSALAEQDKQYVPKTVVVGPPPTKNIRPKGKGKSKAIGRIAVAFITNLAPRLYLPLRCDLMPMVLVL